MSLPHNENTRVQIPALAHLVRLGYTYFSKKDKNFKLDNETNIIIEVFEKSFFKLNPTATQDDFNREFTNIQLELAQDDLGRDFYARLLGKGNSEFKIVDWGNFSNNYFHVASEISCMKDEDELYRPDITTFVNGMPLSYIEVKKPNAIRNGKTGMNSEADRQESRFRMINARKHINITQITTFSDNLSYDETFGFQMQGSYYATTSKGKPKFNSFKEERGSGFPELADQLLPQSDETIDEILKDNNKSILKNSSEFQTNCSENTPLNKFLTSIYSKSRLHMFLQYGIVYVNQINKAGQPEIQKHIMRYPQFFATKAIENSLNNNVKKGVIWHTQGSGKTALTYFNVRYLTDFYQKKGIVPHFYFVVDRLDLAQQAKDEFVKRGLKVKLITDKSELNQDFEGDIVVVNIQKFKDDTKFTDHSGYNLNIQNIYFIDEAHRSYNPKGSYLVNLYNTDEKSIKIALTGTPLIVYKKHSKDDEELSDKEELKTTRSIFGNYIHKYYYNQSIADGYTLRLMREEIQTEYKEQLKNKFNEIKVELGSLDKKKVAAHPKFVKPMLNYLLKDLKEARVRFGDNSIGGMVVADSSDQARELFNQFNSLQEQAVTSSLEDDVLPIDLKSPEKLKAALILHDENDKITREEQVKAFKNGKIDILFVYSMLLTGFDAPRLKKLYLGRKIKAHNLLQTLTRVNRPYKSFRSGYVVDFADISKEFDETNQAYFDELTREYDTDSTGEESSNVFGPLFVSKEEVQNKLIFAQRVLLDYTTDDKEVFSHEVSQIQDRQTLNELRKALVNIRECYNMARLLKFTDLLEKIDNQEISQLLSEVSNRLTTMTLLGNADDSTSEQLLNLAMYNTEFFFKKVDESELALAANDIQEKARKTASEIQRNWDHKDPEWISLYEEFQRVLNKQRMLENATIEDYKRTSKAFDNIYKQIHELNRKDTQLSHKFKGDQKYARTFKRLTNNGKISNNINIYEILSETKEALDEKVSNNQGILNNRAYFELDATSVSRKVMKNLNLVITPKIITDLSKLISDEYYEEFTGEYIY